MRTINSYLLKVTDLLRSKDKHQSGSFSFPSSLIQLKSTSHIKSPGVFSNAYAQECWKDVQEWKNYQQESYYEITLISI